MPIAQSPGGLGIGQAASQGFPVTVSYPQIGIAIGVLPPVFGILIAIAVAVTYHHANATATHCQVANWLPSFSSVIGNNFPEVGYFSAFTLDSTLLCTRMLHTHPSLPPQPHL